MSFPKANIIQLKTIFAVCVSNFFFFLVFNILECQKMKWSRVFIPSGRCWDHSLNKQEKEYVSLLYPVNIIFHYIPVKKIHFLLPLLCISTCLVNLISHTLSEKQVKLTSKLYSMVTLFCSN